MAAALFLLNEHINECNESSAASGYASLPLTIGPVLNLPYLQTLKYREIAKLSVFPGGSAVKNLPANEETQFDPWVRKIPLRRNEHGQTPMDR